MRGYFQLNVNDSILKFSQCQELTFWCIEGARCRMDPSYVNLQFATNPLPDQHETQSTAEAQEIFSYLVKCKDKRAKWINANERKPST